MAKCEYTHSLPGDVCDYNAVIHYDKLNRCAKHADPNVLALKLRADSILRGASGNGWILTTTQCIEIREAIAALEPK